MFKIKANGETTSLSKEQLLQVLVQKVIDNNKQDHKQLAIAVANYLEVSGTLKTVNILQLITLAFSIGYYYKVFLSKNNVEIEIENVPNNSDENTG